MYSIIATPNPVLVQKAKKVTKFDKKLHETLAQMKETLLATTDPVGVGLAAPQVGLAIRIFQMKPTDSSPVTSFINPERIDEAKEANILDHKNSAKVEKKKPKKGKLLEGCLSIPNIWGHVTRKNYVTISWQDEKGGKHKKKFTGFQAVIVQHEMDHLEGVLFTKHVIEQGEKLYKSHKNNEGEEEFDEIKI